MQPTPRAPRSLFQKPRAPNEDELFSDGLKASNVWYGHEQSICWMQPSLPQGSSAPSSYTTPYPPPLGMTWCVEATGIGGGRSSCCMCFILVLCFHRTGFAETMESAGLAKTYEESGWCGAPLEPPLLLVV